MQSKGRNFIKTHNLKQPSKAFKAADMGLQQKNDEIFGRDVEAKCLIKGPIKLNQSSNLTGQRMVTELGFWT